MKKEELDKLKKMFAIGQKSTIVEKLTAIPKRDTGLNVPTTDVLEDNITHQIDLMKLPDDDGYEYCLVVVDLHSRMLGAEPLKVKDAQTVADALLSIYKRSKYLKLPQNLESDQGTEFKGEFKKLFLKKGVRMVYKMPGRHRSQAMVETYNGILAKYLLKRQLATEIHMEGEELNGDWVEDLPKLVLLLNEIRILKDKSKLSKREKERNEASHNGQTPVGEGSALQLIPLGAEVRRQLDEPRDVQGSKQHGKFRKADIRWSQEKYKVVQYSFRPNQPPMYMLDGIKNASFTKNQLQIVSANEKKPAVETINRFIVEKLLSKRVLRGKVQYEVKWKGYNNPSDNTFEYEDKIPSKFVEDYENSIKNIKRKR